MRLVKMARNRQTGPLAGAAVAHHRPDELTWRDDRFDVPRKFAALLRVDPII